MQGLLVNQAIRGQQDTTVSPVCLGIQGPKVLKDHLTDNRALQDSKDCQGSLDKLLL